MVNNVEIMGIESTMKACRYPMSIDLNNVKSDDSRLISLSKCDSSEGHDNALCGIVIQFDLTCSNKMWIEFERYHFADIVSSQSTMHRIAKMDLKKSYNEYVDKEIIEIMEWLVADYNANPTKEKYLKILYSNPSGMNITARVTTNYRQLKTMYKQRKNHRLPEWRDFCDWIETLPYSNLIVGDTNEKQKTI